MAIDIVFLIGRILFGGYFVMNGLHHLMLQGPMTGYAQSKGVPQARTGVVISGLMILLGGLGILLGAYVKVSIILIAVFLVVVSFMMHRYWAIQDPRERAAERINFMKNMALLGALLMFAAFAAPWPYALNLMVL